jgi:hypothetical protein
MIKLRETSMITNFIKERMTVFNLPLIDAIALNVPVIPGATYISNGMFVRYLGTSSEPEPKVYTDLEDLRRDLKDITKFKYLGAYTYNAYYPNLTTTYRPQELEYTTKAHNHFVRCLDFVSEYFNIDVTALCNRFTSEIYTNVRIHTDKFEFSSLDKSYTLYKIKVKPWRTYTIALDSPVGVELITTLDSNSEVTDDKCVSASYHKESVARFNNPFKYTVNVTTELDVYNRRDLYYMILKVPANVKSTITILQGDFTEEYVNKLIQKDDDSKETYITVRDRHQLLTLNDGESYLFSDKLVQYITQRAISTFSSRDDIVALQQYIQEKYPKYYTIEQLGTFEQSLKDALLRIANDNHLFDTCYDLLGFYDRDIERIVGEILH